MAERSNWGEEGPKVSASELSSISEGRGQHERNCPKLA